MSVLRVEEVYKSFPLPDGRLLKVLDGVSFDVEKDSLTCIVGPNGCGKTTLLRIISGLMKPDRGTIKVRGRKVFMIFQEGSLFPWLTLYENIRIVSSSRDEALSLLREYGLLKYSDLYPSRLSGGMKQIAELVRAIALKPGILLMDEPFASLDAQNRILMQEKMLEILSKTNLTVLFVTHNVEEAVFLADRIVVLSSKPSKVKLVLDIESGKPRDRMDSRFMDVRRKIESTLRRSGEYE